MNISSYGILNCDKIHNSIKFYDRTREINIFATIIIIIIGLIGNILGVIVFIQKRFRLKSPGIFLLCLAISDGLFLLTHFFEDTVRTYIDVYVTDNDMKSPYAECNTMFFKNITTNSTKTSIFLSINITDRFEVSCRLVNFLRYFLRFVSAYIITIFTIQRAIAVFFPFLQTKFSSSRLAWKTVVGLLFIATALCSFVPFLFNINADPVQRVIYCDTNKSTPRLYFITTNIYIALIMFIPITTIIICNSFIIFQICRAGNKRKLMISGQYVENEDVNHNCDKYQKIDNKHNLSKKSNLSVNINNYNNGFNAKSSLLQHNRASDRNRKNIAKCQNDSHRVTRMLIIMSLSYAILNLPYFITWCLFYYNQAYNKSLIKTPDGFAYSRYLFGWINITEIFYVLNYGIHFFLYCASGKQFRKQLKYSFVKSKKRTHI